MEEVKRVVAEARRKPGTLTPAPQADFNEDDFMDGMQPNSPSGSPSKAAKYDRPAHHHCPPPPTCTFRFTALLVFLCSLFLQPACDVLCSIHRMR